MGFDRALEKVESHRGRKEQVRIVAGPFNSCVALGMLLNLSEPHLMYKMGIIVMFLSKGYYKYLDT